MSCHVCLLTSGTGSRLGELTKFMNKSLVTVANKPALAHIIEKFPQDAEFVIALGYKGRLVKDFLELAYPERNFTLVNVFPFEGVGSGVGHSLLACKDHLQIPFIFSSCDTLVDEDIPSADRNWIGSAKVDLVSDYRTISIGENSLICEKNVSTLKKQPAYIGLAGIHHVKAFWNAMEAGANEAVDKGEIWGLNALSKEGFDLEVKNFTWFDTGNPKSLAEAREAYQRADSPNILEKSNEAIWFVGSEVIKFSDDNIFISRRVERAEILSGFVPPVTGSKANMYKYSKVEGSVLSDVITIPLFNRLLEQSINFWQVKKLDEKAHNNFKNGCKNFYKEKTLERINLFYKNFGRSDGTQAINGVKMPALKSLLDNLDWDWLSDGLPVRFHGDFHFENIIWNPVENQFTFLDWRQDFSGDLHVGDIYYDFAKLLHGLIVNHGIIAENQYLVSWSKDEISFDLNRKQVLVECERRMGSWLGENGYDKRKVWVLTALIYLNIAALHHYPYSLLLYALGKSMLTQKAFE